MRTSSLYSESELIIALRERDQKAFVYLYNHYSGALYSIILQIVPNQEVANDILHDAFMHFWRKIDIYNENRCRLFTWMLNITRNFSIDTIGSKAYQEMQKNNDVPEVIHMNVDSRLSELPVNEFGLRKLLDELSVEDGSLIDLCYFKGYSKEEISDIEDISLHAVNTRIGGAFIQLREHLK